MERPNSIPYGKKVRLTQDYERKGVQSGVVLQITPERIQVAQKDPLLPNVVTLAGSIGLVEELIHSEDINKYNSEECPVEFEVPKVNPIIVATRADAIGIPWGLLEFVD